MNNTLNYKDYFALIEYSSEDDVFIGKVQGVVDVIVFEGNSIKELKKAFEDTIEDYLDLCQRIGKEPNKTFKGSFNVRISPEMHKNCVRLATKQGITLNEFVSRAIEEKMNQHPKQTMNINIQVTENNPPRISNWENPMISNIMPTNRVKEYFK